MNSRNLINVTAYNSGLIDKLKQGRTQKRIAIFALFFLLFQAVSPFATFITQKSVKAAGVGTWAEVTTTGAPSARTLRLKESVKTDDGKVIVWGGYNSSGDYSNTGGIYDPATNTWTSIPFAGQYGPASRFAHNMEWVNGKLYIWGGAHQSGYGNLGGTNSGDEVSDCEDVTTVTEDFCYFHSGWIFTPGGTDGLNNGPWKKMNLPTDTILNARNSVRSVVTNDSKIIIWGGRNADDVSSNTGGIYDTVTDSWTIIPDRWWLKCDRYYRGNLWRQNHRSNCSY